MNIVWLLLGVVIGWCIEWVVDRLYWRGRLADLNTQVEESKEMVANLEAAVAELNGNLAAEQENSQTLQAQLTQLQTQTEADLLSRDERISELENTLTLNETKASVLAEREAFEIAWRDKQLTELGQDSASYAGQVDVLKQENRTLNEQLGVALQNAAGDKSARDKSILALEASLQTLQSKLSSAEANNADLQKRIEDLRTAKSAEFAPTQPDRLQKINGIGNVFASRLNSAGIYTFAQLAELTSERIQEILQPKAWQVIDADAWIREAAGFADKED